MRKLHEAILDHFFIINWAILGRGWTCCVWVYWTHSGTGRFARGIERKISLTQAKREAETKKLVHQLLRPKRQAEEIVLVKQLPQAKREAMNLFVNQLAREADKKFSSIN